jgi:hypothetical protein
MVYFMLCRTFGYSIKIQLDYTARLCTNNYHEISVQFVWLISHQPAVLFLSEQISHQELDNSTFLLEQTSTSHQPPAK